MNKHKAKCDTLKKIRKGVADKLGVDLHQQECTFEGNCTGTCPKCKQEEDILNKEILKRATGLAIGATASLMLTACGPFSDNVISDNIEAPLSYTSDNVMGGFNVILEEREKKQEPEEVDSCNTDEQNITELSGDVSIAEPLETSEVIESIEDTSEPDTSDSGVLGFQEDGEALNPEIVAGELPYERD